VRLNGLESLADRLVVSKVAEWLSGWESEGRSESMAVSSTGRRMEVKLQVKVKVKRRFMKVHFVRRCAPGTCQLL
jgi:hypothetical protein